MLGFIGLFLPLWPTTPFILVAAWAFARSSPQLHEALMQHRRFGPLLRDWHQYRAIPRRAKIITIISMVVSFIVTLVFAPHWGAPLVAGIVMLMSGTYVVTRPEPPPRPASIEGDGL